MLLGGKTQYCKAVNSTTNQSIILHAMPIKTPTGIFMELDKKTLKFS